MHDVLHVCLRFRSGMFRFPLPFPLVCLPCTQILKPQLFISRLFSETLSSIYFGILMFIRFICSSFLPLDFDSWILLLLFFSKCSYINVPLYKTRRCLIILTTDKICREYRASRSREAAYFLMRLCASFYTGGQSFRPPV